MDSTLHHTQHGRAVPTRPHLHLKINVERYTSYLLFFISIWISISICIYHYLIIPQNFLLSCFSGASLRQLLTAPWRSPARGPSRKGRVWTKNKWYRKHCPMGFSNNCKVCEAGMVEIMFARKHWFIRNKVWEKKPEFLEVWKFWHCLNVFLKICLNVQFSESEYVCYQKCFERAWYSSSSSLSCFWFKISDFQDFDLK